MKKLADIVSCIVYGTVAFSGTDVEVGTWCVSRVELAWVGRLNVGLCWTCTKSLCSGRYMMCESGWAHLNGKCWSVQDLRQKLIELQHREKAAKEETEIYKKQLFEVSQAAFVPVLPLGVATIIILIILPLLMHYLFVSKPLAIRPSRIERCTWDFTVCNNLG